MQGPSYYMPENSRWKYYCWIEIKEHTRSRLTKMKLLHIIEIFDQHVLNCLQYRTSDARC
jgi:hypothetical protein